MRSHPLISAAICLASCVVLVGACSNENEPSLARASAALRSHTDGICPSGTTMCPGWLGCIDLMTSSQHCGACGTACGSEQECVDGACQDTPCKGFKYCDCGLWVAANDTCPARTCDPCEEGFTYCGCPSGGCLVNDLTCSPEPDECGNGICRGALRDCGGGVQADPDAACPGGTHLGDAAIEANPDSNADGVAEAFQYTATSTGTISVLSVYIDVIGGSTATSLELGLYSDDSGNPGTLLTRGATPFAFQRGWLTLSVPSVSVTSGEQYWIAILAPEGTGTVHFRDVDDGSSTSQTSAESSLTTLPTTWTTGTVWSTSSASAYASE